MRRLMTGLVVVGLAVALVAPAFATGKQVTCWLRAGSNTVPFWGSAYDGIRFQALIDQTQIKYKGKITQVELYNYYGRTGTYNNYKLILCHCGSTSLSKTFGANYKGTPVTVATLDSFTIPARQDWFPLGMTTVTFDYNNTDHFLIEVQWKGDNGVVCHVCTGAQVPGNHRVYAFNDPEAPSGLANPLTYYTRLSFGYYTAAEPTSLGRVKAMY